MIEAMKVEWLLLGGLGDDWREAGRAHAAPGQSFFSTSIRSTRYQEKEQEGSATGHAHQLYRSTNVTISRVTLVVKAHADHVLIAGPPGSLICNDNSRIVGG
jgi:hypothetical protein